jgi:hypothetical protein
MLAGLVLATLLAGDLAADPLRGSPCPSPAEVETELAKTGVTGVAPPEVELVGDRMHVSLRSRDGATLGSREVDAPSDCRERATVTAVLVATWMGIWPEGPRPPSVTPTADPVPVPVSPRRIEIGLTLGGAYDGNAAAPGIALEARRELLGPWWIWVGVAASTDRELAFGQAKAGYVRPALELGPAVRLGSGALRVDLAASGRLGIASFRGKDMPVTYAKTHLVSGASGNLRLILQRQSLSPFLVATATYWMGGQRLTVDDAAGISAALPRWDAGLGLGLFWSP